MTLSWHEEAGLPAGADPYAAWLQELGGPRQITSWTPLIVQVPALRDTRTQQSVLAILDNKVFRPATAEQPTMPFRINPHDVIHWAHFALKSLDKPSELILLAQDFAAAQEEKRALEQALLAATDGTGPSTRAREGFDAVFQGLIDVAVALNEPHIAAEKGAGDTDDHCVVTAIIDHAIPFAHARFRAEQTHTRIVGLWRQGHQSAGPLGPPHAETSNAPALGTAAYRAGIDESLQGLETGAIESEEALYTEGSFKSGPDPKLARRPGDSPLAKPRSHGGQMLDIAAGQDPGASAGTRNPILAVELPAQLIARANGFLFEPYVKSAMNWIWLEMQTNPDLVGRRRSVVLNYSFGDFVGRHDGSDVLDADFQLRLDRAEFDLISVPAGNGFLRDIHARITPADLAHSTELEMWVQPDTRSVTLLQIWMDQSHSGPLPFRLDIQPPRATQAPTGPLRSETSQALRGADGEVLGRVFVQNRRPPHPLPEGLSADMRTCVTLALRPTGAADQPGPFAPCGRWRLTFACAPEAKPEDSGTLNLWIERNDSVEGFPQRGRQAYFDHADHIWMDPETGRPEETLDGPSPVRRDGSIGANTASRGVIVAAAFEGARSPHRPAIYSGAGRSVPGAAQPTLSAVAGDSAARRNLLAAGTSSGVTRAIDGTSAAAALVTRAACAALLARPEAIGTPDAGGVMKAELLGATAPWTPGPFAPGSGLTGAPARIGAGVLSARFSKSPPRFEDSWSST